MIFRLGELFCGPGGLAWGATNADIGDPNWKIVHQWSNDYDENTCKTYRRNICPKQPETVYHEDIRKFDLTHLADIDALAFGFPCNDYSVVGEQKGMDGIYGPLYSYGVKVLQLYHPKWFLAENVGGLKNANDGKAFTKILDEMRKAGYKLYPNLYKFEDYGIPQARHRIIIVGIREDIDLNIEELALETIKFLKKSYQPQLYSRYDITEDIFDNVDTETMMNPENAAALCIMEHIARKRGCIKKGSDIDYEKCAACILDDFREGKIGTISLERP